MDVFYDYVVDGIRRLDPSTEIVFKGHPDMRGKTYYVPPGVRDITYQDADEVLEECKVIVVGTSLLGEHALFLSLLIVHALWEDASWVFDLSFFPLFLPLK